MSLQVVAQNSHESVVQALISERPRNRLTGWGEEREEERQRLNEPHRLQILVRRGPCVLHRKEPRQRRESHFVPRPE